MLKAIDPSDRSIRKFTVYKQFTVTQADSGSFVFGLECISGSIFDFNVASAPSRSYTITTAPYSQSFFKEPLYYQVKKMYYSDLENQYATFGSNDTATAKRELGNKVNIITIPQNLFGEQIKPKSIKLTDNSTDITFDIRDDGYGNLYDWAYSSSYAAGTPSAAGSGSQIGNIFYSHGILTITNSGSYNQIGLGEGTNGFEVHFQSAHTIYEHEYNCVVGENEFNRSINISATIGYSGSITVLQGSPNASNLFPPGNAPDTEQLNPSRNEIDLQSLYSQSLGYRPEYNIKPGSDFYNDFSQDTGVADPFGKYRNPVFRNKNQLMVGNPVGIDIGTLYKNKTYTFSIYMKWSGSAARQGRGMEFDLADIGINGRQPGLYKTYVDKVQFTGSLNDQVSTEWQRFQLTAKHVGKKESHHIQVGDWFGNGYFLWSCPQIELGVKMTDFVNDIDPKIIQPPITEYQLIGEVTHSDWAPYITTIGLYNDFNQLIAIGKLSRPIKNDPELTYNLVVRFDA